MDMKKLLEAVTKFAGEPEQKPGDQVRGTDVAKDSKGGKHPFLNQLVGDSKEIKKRDADRALEESIAEAWANFMEDDIGTHPKRPQREGSRHPRGHEPKSGYTTVKDEELNEATRDEAWEGWTIRHETDSKRGQPVRWMAFHAKRGPQDAHKGQSDSVESALADAKAWIQSGGNAKEITTSSVTIDFNVKFASEIVNGNDFYAKIVAGPTLVISMDAKPGFKRSHIRTQKSKATEETTLLPMISMTGAEANAAGLKAHGRYLLGNTEQDQEGNTTFSLIYQSTVQAKGDVMRLGKPALTVAMNREVSGLEEGWESGPEERSSRERDPDAGYDADRQERADAEAQAQQDKRPQTKVYTLTGRGPNMEPNYKFPGEYASQDEADAARTKLMADPKTPNPRMIGISSHTKYMAESIESADPVESAVLIAVQELIQQGHTEVAPEVITNMVVAAISQPFLLKDLVDANNNSSAIQHYVDSIDPNKVKFSSDILTVKNENPAKKSKQQAQAGVSAMASRAANRSRLGESEEPIQYVDGAVTGSMPGNHQRVRTIKYSNGVDTATVEPNKGGWLVTMSWEGDVNRVQFTSGAKAQAYLEDYGFDLLDDLTDEEQLNELQIIRPRKDVVTGSRVDHGMIGPGTVERIDPMFTMVRADSDSKLYKVGHNSVRPLEDEKMAAESTVNESEIISGFRKELEDLQASDKTPAEKQAIYTYLVDKFSKQAAEYSKGKKTKVDEYGTVGATGTVGTTGTTNSSTAPATPAKPDPAATQALSTIKSATSSSAPVQNIEKALDSASQGTAVNSQDMKALEPMMKDVATIAQDPKLANQFKSLASQANQAQQKQQK